MATTGRSGCEGRGTWEGVAGVSKNGSGGVDASERVGNKQVDAGGLSG